MNCSRSLSLRCPLRLLSLFLSFFSASFLLTQTRPEQLPADHHHARRDVRRHHRTIGPRRLLLSRVQGRRTAQQDQTTGNRAGRTDGGGHGVSDEDAAIRPLHSRTNNSNHRFPRAFTHRFGILLFSRSRSQQPVPSVLELEQAHDQWPPGPSIVLPLLSLLSPSSTTFEKLRREKCFNKLKLIQTSSRRNYESAKGKGCKGEGCNERREIKGAELGS